MYDVWTYLAQLKRPKILVRAAEKGASQYQRSTHLPRLLGPCADDPCTGVLNRLIEDERDQNTLRKQHHAEYSPARHLEYLIALISEIRGLRQI